MASSTPRPTTGRKGSFQDGRMAIPVVPKKPSKCPLFCCFYSEFDIKKGTVICFESPKGFMDTDINASKDVAHDLLEKTFQEIVPNLKDHGAEQGNESPGGTVRTDGEHSKETGAATEKEASQAAASLRTGQPSSPPPVTSSPSDAPSGMSIFDSTSEYIITGSELTSKIITLSTHSWHIMTRPTLISDARYQRNAHLFSVGIVLRRAADPRPFRPLISKLALSLEAMEKESNFLTGPTTRPQIQSVLEQVLVSLNSAEWECNLLLNNSNLLNMKLYHPPKPETSRVYDHQVPILLRLDFQLQMYSWDLAINWVILYIDGVVNARQISIKAEVDLEMVRACLRVLKHHGVIALVSQFSYTNRYEFTPKATAMLAGQDSGLMQEALEFSLRRQSTAQHSNGSHSQHDGGSAAAVRNPRSTSGGSDHGPNPWSTNSNSHALGSLSTASFAPRSPNQATPSSSYPPRTMELLGGSQQSYTFRSSMMARSLERENSIGSRRVEEQRLWKTAIAELYCACNRNISFGDLWLSLATEAPAGIVTVPTQSGTHKNSMYSTGGMQRSFSSRRKGSIAEEYPEEPTDHSSFHATSSLVENLALSPSETHRLESLRKSGYNNDGDAVGIDWHDFFQRIDHRRFLTFGLIHGLLVRVHAFPCFPHSFPDEPESGTTSPVTVPGDIASAGYGWAATNSTTTTHTTGISSSGNASGSKQSLKKVFLEQKAYKFAKNVAQMMDGSRCDDELACKFEKPYNKLTELVESYGKCKVISFHAEWNDE